jgi:hypothetical protein
LERIRAQSLARSPAVAIAATVAVTGFELGTWASSFFQDMEIIYNNIFRERETFCESHLSHFRRKENILWI